MRSIGPYDYWAIEYGYKPLSGGTQGEAAALARWPRAAMSRRCDSPPTRTPARWSPIRASIVLISSKDPMEFARWRLELISQILPELVDHVVEPGEGYDRVRKALGILLREHDRVMGFVAREIGGVNMNRNHKGDPNGATALHADRAKETAGGTGIPGTPGFRSRSLSTSRQALRLHRRDALEALGNEKPRAARLRRERNRALDARPRAGTVLSPITLSRILDSEAKTPSARTPSPPQNSCRV